VERASIIGPARRGRAPALGGRLSAAGAARAATLAALAGMGVAAVLICLEAGARATTVVPASVRDYPGWLRGPLPEMGDGLTEGRFAALFLVMCGSYLALLALHRHLSVRPAVGAIVLLHALFVLAPPLHSTDVFGYIDWARLGTVHDLDPYTHGFSDAPDDPALDYLRWDADLPTPYGPVFTLATYPLGPLGLATSLWILKAATGLAALGCVALVWACARRMGRDPLGAAVFVGLNPILLVFEVGGAHNDVFFMALALGGAYLLLAGRDAAGAGTVLTAASLKASAGLLLPFAVLGSSSRRRALLGAVAATTAVGAVALAGFGSNALGFLKTLESQQDQVALWAVPNSLSRWLGLGGMTPGVRALSIAAFAAMLVWMLVRTARGADWITAAGWATLALLVTSAWLLPWYVVWLLPLAALGDDRRLRLATLALCAFVIAVRLPVWLEQPLYP
jgi:alpha-1,6-mannosyltransferase